MAATNKETRHFQKLSRATSPVAGDCYALGFPSAVFRPTPNFHLIRIPPTHPIQHCSCLVYDTKLHCNHSESNTYPTHHLDCTEDWLHWYPPPLLQCCMDSIWSYIMYSHPIPILQYCTAIVLYTCMYFTLNIAHCATYHSESVSPISNAITISPRFYATNHNKTCKSLIDKFVFVSFSHSVCKFMPSVLFGFVVHSLCVSDDCLRLISKCGGRLSVCVKYLAHSVCLPC